MEIIDTSSEGMTLRVTAHEAMIINNALNELCNGYNLSDADLHARSGATREEIRSALRTINDSLRQ